MTRPRVPKKKPMKRPEEPVPMPVIPEKEPKRPYEPIPMPRIPEKIPVYEPARLSGFYTDVNNNCLGLLPTRVSQLEYYVII